MATIILTAVGTAVGGPLGGAIGSLIGSQIDRAIFGSPGREGPRLRELGVTTSSYGTSIPLHYGTMRVPGTIIWSTDLVESSDETGGGKGQPSVTTYNYSASFAVALSSRPIQGIGRVWADGNLLRGAAGDLKAGGKMRIYLGHGDQQADPLIQAERAEVVPAFRGLAYCVFESLQLADFGNRIPSLTFELFADNGEVNLSDVIGALPGEVIASRKLTGLSGFSNEGGPMGSSLATIGQAYPLACVDAEAGLTFEALDSALANPPLLPDPVTAPDTEAFGVASGWNSRRQRDAREVPSGLRFYDTSRDYQAGVQRADGRARSGRERIVEFPGALASTTARNLINAAAEAAMSATETLSWRIAEIDTAIGPGSAVRVPGHSGLWRVDSWEWRDGGVELQLQRMPRGPARQTPADSGTSLVAPDFVATPTQLAAFELPWDGNGDSGVRQVFAAASSASRGWTGAALYLVQSGNLVPIGSTGSRRSIIGTIVTDLPPSRSILPERLAHFDVSLASGDFFLAGTDMEGLANGANRALVGDEIVQFASATPLGDARWRLGGLVRGRGGTEVIAQNVHPLGTRFVLLDGKPVALDPARLPANPGNSIAAIGLVDEEPVVAAIAREGATLRPLTPVHARSATGEDGTLRLQWTRRARGAWHWPDLVELPINEQAEAYLVGLGDPDSPFLVWEVSENRLTIAPADAAAISSQYPGAQFWVRQVGSFSSSDPLLLAHA